MCFTVEVVIQLISSKYMPILLYALEACALNKSDITSLDFALSGFYMKLVTCKLLQLVKNNLFVVCLVK